MAYTRHPFFNLNKTIVKAKAPLTQAKTTLRKATIV